MSDPNRFLRMTIDVCVFTEDEPRAAAVAARVVKEGKGNSFGVGERLAREFMDQIKAGRIEIDDIRDVEVH